MVVAQGDVVVRCATSLRHAGMRKGYTTWVHSARQRSGAVTHLHSTADTTELAPADTWQVLFAKFAVIAVLRPHMSATPPTPRRGCKL